MFSFHQKKKKKKQKAIWLDICQVLFSRFYGPRRKKKRKKEEERGQYPVILTKQAWSIKDLLYSLSIFKLQFNNKTKQHGKKFFIAGRCKIYFYTVFGLQQERSLASNQQFLNETIHFELYANISRKIERLRIRKLGETLIIVVSKRQDVSFFGELEKTLFCTSLNT